jgi:ATP-dependent RNA helicase MSS116, mitochondrial
MQTQKQVKSPPSKTKKRQYSTFNRQAQNGSPAPKKPGPSPYSTISTPPLSTPVPQDTPRFADLGSQNIIHPTLLQTITEDLKFDHMMPVQAATLHELLQNKIDCLAQARTGTGKTISFLLPAIQNMIDSRRLQDAGISMLVLSPTRELAMQIAKEANSLLQRFPQYRVQFAIGGTNKNIEEKAILSGCEILIATPGRLLDHMSDERIRYQFRALQTLVLDEADRMLDMGFLPDIKKIIGYLPDKTQVSRQSMLFSATIAGQIQSVAHLILNEGYKFISTIPAGETNTHERVPQFLVVAPTMSDVALAMMAAIKAEFAVVSPGPFKAIVFAPTAALADFYGHVLANVKGLPTVSVLHSRISQTKRTNTTQKFREASSAICVATDVIARGMDFPGVTHVFQVGIPSEKEAYIHRLGRTARADAEGRGIIILTEQEKFFLYQLKDIKFEEFPHRLQYTQKDIEASLDTLDNKAKIYQAWMGYYKNHLKALRWSTAELVQQANVFAFQGLGCPEVPGLQKNTIQKMGLKGVPGLKVLPNEARSNDPRRRGGGEGRGISGGAGRSRT